MPNSSGVVRLGPWGGESGTPWNYLSEGPITRITITSDNHVIHSVSFISQDLNGTFDQSPNFGTPTGPLKEININTRVEKLVLMEGIVDTYNSIETVTQLSFTTSRNGVTTKHGPYGSSDESKGNKFSCELIKDLFSGFHGHSGPFLNSIGVSVELNVREVVPSWGGFSGSLWSYTTNGIISHIFISYADVIRAIRFKSVDSHGHSEDSQIFGDSNTNYDYHEIEIESASEKLNGVRGTYGTYNNETILTSLCFTTNNKRTFGPFGTRMGDPFSYTVDDEEVIAGFHGRSGALIDAIGVYKRPSILSSSGALVGRVGRIVTSICFESKDEQGTIVRSPVYGKEGKQTFNISFDAKTGKLNGISGTVKSFGIGLLITSLSFSTDKKIVYGPYYDGDAQGSPFSIPIKDGFISGFHGSTAEAPTPWLRSLGVYVNPA